MEMHGEKETKACGREWVEGEEWVVPADKNTDRQFDAKTTIIDCIYVASNSATGPPFWPLCAQHKAEWMRCQGETKDWINEPMAANYSRE